MPSLQSLPPPPPLMLMSSTPVPSPSQYYHHRPISSHLIPPVAGATAAAFSFLLILITLFRKITRKRTAPADSKPPHRFSYSVLRRATSSFSPSNRLGQGGFGSVYRGSLPSGQSVAVKVMDHGSLQGEREFQNELLFAGMLDSPHILSVLGFCSHSKHHRMLLVYELMSNGNLQDALLHRKCAELREWKKRFSIALEIAKGIAYLHGLDTPVIHGDIKPSNILLDEYFSAKISDFGLARLKSENECGVTIVESDAGKMNSVLEKKKGESKNNGEVGGDDYGSVVETESVMTGFEECNVGVQSVLSPETVEVVVVGALPEGLEKGSVSEGNFDRASVESGKGIRNISGKDWWWKQGNGVREMGPVKDYVMEWIGTEIKKERPKSNWIGASSTSSGGKLDKKKKKKSRKRLDWWMSFDEDNHLKKEKRRPAREWWKEEYCDELAKKNNKKKKKREMALKGDDDGGEDWWQHDEDLYSERKKRSRSRSSRSSVDWWLDGLSGELWRGRYNSKDSISGEIPKSSGMSSTPSMRGTVCYIAPEYGGGEDLSEKCDVYSFGVLLLVLIAGRRPLQLTGSPMSEFQRANLLSWARHLARGGKLLDLVDQSVQSLDKEQAHLCIKVALLCLQKLPTRRSSMKEVVGMLTGDLDLPQLPFEFSPSPPSHFPSKSQKKARHVEHTSR